MGGRIGKGFGWGMGLVRGVGGDGSGIDIY